MGVPSLGVLIMRILLFSPLFSETPIWVSGVKQRENWALDDRMQGCKAKEAILARENLGCRPFTLQISHACSTVELGIQLYSVVVYQTISS